MKNFYFFAGILGCLVAFCRDTALAYPAPSNTVENGNEAADLDLKELIEVDRELTNAVVRELAERIKEILVKGTDTKNEIPEDYIEAPKRGKPPLCLGTGWQPWCGKKR